MYKFHYPPPPFGGERTKFKEKRGKEKKRKRKGKKKNMGKKKKEERKKKEGNKKVKIGEETLLKFACVPGKCLKINR